MGTGTWAVQTVTEAVMTWNYNVEHPELRALYEKAKREQWNATTQLPWTQDVDPEGILLDDDINPNVALLRDSDLWRRMTPQEHTRLRHETLAWNLSQFLHGEQLAMFVAGQLTSAVPWIDAKLYGSTQVVDEARHAEVFYRYLHEKLEHEYPLSETTKGLFETILHESRWDVKYLGLQVVLEGLAMGLFTRMYQAAQEPLLRELLHFVRQDEARHFAFGVLSLRDTYRDMLSETERREREDFAFEVCRLMRGRTYPKEAWETIGLPVEECRRAMGEAARQSQAQLSSFTRVTSALKTVGMLSDRMRPHYAQIGLLKYEDTPMEELQATGVAAWGQACALVSLARDTRAPDYATPRPSMLEEYMAFATRPASQKYLILGLLTFFFLALSIEFSLYLLIEFGVLNIEKPTYSIDNALSRFWVESNANFGVWHEPHARYRNLKSCFDVTYTANAHGARDVERSVEHQGPRVVVLGDSFVEGYGVALEERFSNVLERETRLEHLNFGTSGHFGPIQYYLLYKTLAKQFAHSAVLIGIFPGNDFLDNDYEYSKNLHSNRYRPYFIGTYPYYRLIYDQEHIDRSVNTVKNIIREFTFSYATYNRIKTILLHKKHHVQSGYYHFTDEQFQIMKYSIEKIVQEAPGKAVHLFTIPQLSDFQDYKDHGEAPLATRLRALSQELAIGYVDLLPYMYHRTQDWAQYYASCDGHWNAHGHYVASEYLQQHIPLYHTASH